MTYISLARKYRPQEFDEIVGQEHIATTLKNAIAMNMVAHAYLFAGPRGVGKTSTARILAKSLNCKNGPTSKPCQKCTSCSEISQGISMDAIEIDGASNRGIDEIRNLRENVKFASVHGKFRIYIIDEVHMLTQEAFNALLKTLEEPPLHVKFVFATTKPYKVPPTIISRCQRFDFRKIPTGDIVKKLEDIKTKEKLDTTAEAVFLIAKAADGSLRDAEVILEQLLSFTKGKVEAGDVVKALGLMEKEILFSLADCIINNEKNEILSIINNLIDSGRDPVFIASCIIDHFRNIMVAKVAKDASGALRDVSEEDYHHLQEQGQKLTLDGILYITYTLSQAIELMKKTPLSRIPLEISLIKLSETKKLASVKEILDRLSRIEASFSESPAPQEVTEDRPQSVPTPTPAVQKEEVAAERDILLLQKIKTSWPKILNFVKNKKMSLGTFLSEGALIRVRDNILDIGFNKDKSLSKETLEANTNKKFVEEAIKNIVGENMSLSLETLEAATEGATGTVELEDEEAEGIVRDNRNEIEPIVESALDIFDGKIIDVRKEKYKENKK